MSVSPKAFFCYSLGDLPLSPSLASRFSTSTPKMLIFGETNLLEYAITFFNPSNLLRKQTLTPSESFSGWLFRYLLLRVHMALAGGYVLLLVFLKSDISCMHNTEIKDELINEMCRLNYTYIIRFPVLEPFGKSSANWRRFPSAFKQVLRQETAGSEREYFYYYPFVLFILAVLVSGIQELLLDNISKSFFCRFALTLLQTGLLWSIAGARSTALKATS